MQRKPCRNAVLTVILLTCACVRRPAIVVLLMSMVNEKQPFVLRCAVLYCFQSFLYKNEIGQSQIIMTLLPTTAEGEPQLSY